MIAFMYKSALVGFLFNTSDIKLVLTILEKTIDIYFSNKLIVQLIKRKLNIKFGRINSKLSFLV